MRTAEFDAAMRQAAYRALGEGLSPEDLRLMVKCGRAWERAGRPDSGVLGNAWHAAWTVCLADQKREECEQELADWIALEYETATSPVVREAIPEVGVLAEWWAELRAGYRTRYDFDALWRAACLEARARGCERDGQYSAATEDRRRAAEIVLQAAVEAI